MKKIAMGLCLFLLAEALLSPYMVLAASAPAGAAPTTVLAAAPTPGGTGEEGGSAGEGDTDLQLDPEAKASLQAIVDERDIMALVYLGDYQTICQQPSYDSPQVVSAPSGQSVFIQGILRDDMGEIWARVSLYYMEELCEGYLPRRYLATSDERFLAWERMYDMAPINRMRVVGYQDIYQFPESYQASLLTLKNSHPNWTFVPMNTGLNWGDVVAGQMYDSRSLVPRSFDSYMSRGPYGDGTWHYASETAVTYYLDPRNWLNEEYIFQFEQLTYNASYHTEGAVQSLLNNTFMAGIAPSSDKTYARIFWEIGQELGVSPFHLANRVYHEQGVNGSSPLISGTHPGFEGYYNYYNISAAGSNNEEIFRTGLTRAVSEGWNSPYASIKGGANFLTSDYIRIGQDTSYLQKFDLVGTLYTHQYMQAVYAPATEAKNIRRLYSEVGALDNTFVFKIPVYNNMPADNCILPTTSFNISMPIPAGYSGDKIYLDGIEYTGFVQDGHLSVNAGGPQATTATMYKYNEAGIPIGMYVWTLYYVNGKYTATAVPELEDLLTYHGFSIRITGNAGIRFKTGLLPDTRAGLLSGGVAGYTLKEYGTLVMNNANRPQYSLVKGGEKVTGGVAYGTDSNGNFRDAIYETVDGRHRYTSVLVGLPAEQYKTEFAFRGYIILTQNGRDYVFYGPPRSQSIYTLAQALLASGEYAEGSEIHSFLQNLIVSAG